MMLLMTAMMLLVITATMLSMVAMVYKRHSGLYHKQKVELRGMVHTLTASTCAVLVLSCVVDTSPSTRHHHAVDGSLSLEPEEMSLDAGVGGTGPYCASDDEGLIPEVTRLVFIKTHKTGSSTIANILYRFGSTRRLRFYAPNKYAFTDRPPKSLAVSERGQEEPFDICHLHGRNGGLGFDAIFQWYRNLIAGAEFVTILRDPVQRYISDWNFFQRPKMKVDVTPGSNRDDGNTIEEALLRYTRAPGTHNRMAFDLGIHNQSELDEFIRTGMKKIAMILVSDRMVESLVIMKRVFHWRLDGDLMHLRVLDSCRSNVARWDGLELACSPAASDLSPEVVDRIREVNSLDAQLYKAANERLDRQISEAMAHGYEAEMTRIKSQLAELASFCDVDHTHPRYVRCAFPCHLYVAHTTPPPYPHPRSLTD
eukprot:TRINITY_DN2866_c0_g1_i2.p1 TRINITY_DN2866_c0_g1~~TRINITY_DN2866_c0_g1_i2.p1  ORF type:complete len:425 (+),score=46.21 TRINITY_DN2866_c0_g1_i2:379-1653(+)